MLSKLEGPESWRSARREPDQLVVKLHVPFANRFSPCKAQVSTARCLRCGQGGSLALSSAALSRPISYQTRGSLHRVCEVFRMLPGFRCADGSARPRSGSAGADR